MQNEVVRALTGLRGAAILIVLVSHMFGRELGGFYDYVNFQGIGRTGIYIFFVLSAFLCHQSLERHTLSGYFTKRFFRIAPSFFFVLAGLLIFGSFNEYNDSYLHIEGNPLLHFLFVRGDGIFWTIPTEVFYYFLIPLVAIYLKPIPIAALALLYFLWFLASSALNNIPAPVVIFNEHSSQYLDVFMLGSLAFFLKDHPFWKKLFSYRAVNIFLIVAPLAGMALMCRQLFGIDVGPLKLTRELSFPWAMLVAIYLLGIYHNVPMLTQPLSNKVMLFLGKYAYTIYLIHMAAFQIANSFFDPSFFRSAFALGLTILMAVTISKFVESPGISIGDKIIKSNTIRARQTAALREND